jgi:hypothetical protein
VIELYRPSDCRLSAQFVPTSAGRGCHVVSMTDPYSSILGFLDRRSDPIRGTLDLLSNADRGRGGGLSAGVQRQEPTCQLFPANTSADRSQHANCFQPRPVQTGANMPTVCSQYQCRQEPTCQLFAANTSAGCKWRFTAVSRYSVPC